MNSKMIGGILLICGTSVGTGILGIPSDTGEAGFGWSMILFVLCWVFSTLAALYYLEIHLWQKNPSSNLLSMTQSFFGPKIKKVVWVVYLALLYSLMCTYLLAGSSWILQSATYMWQINMQPTVGMLLFITLIGLFIFFGIRVVDHVNRAMSIGLALTYILILWITLPTVDVKLLAQPAQSIAQLPQAIPLLITAFGYSIIVPSLSIYFERDSKILQKTILWGSLVTLVIYVLWELATLGNIPLYGSHGLREIAHSLDNGTGVANALIHITRNSHLTYIITLFAMFAVITSFLGVSMALFHTLADGLDMEVKGIPGVILLGLTYLPPILFLKLIPTGFNQILSWAGMLLAFLMGVLPMLMIFKGRYQLKYKGYKVLGGRFLAVLVIVFFGAVMIVELFK